MLGRVGGLATHPRAAAGALAALAALLGVGAVTWGRGGGGSGGVLARPCRLARPLAVSQPRLGFEAGQAVTPGLPQGWGTNVRGNLGTGAARYSNVAVSARDLWGVVALAGGAGHTLALRRDGVVWSWGDNGSGQFGRAAADCPIGDGQIACSPAPAPVVGLHGVVVVATGDAHSLALRRDGTVWAWGDNESGQAGVAATAADGQIPGTVAPARVPGLSCVAAVAAGGRFSLALEADGTVWGWGYNGDRQLGVGLSAYSDSARPARIDGLDGIAAIAAGGAHGLALRGDGTVWAWGDGAGPARVAGLAGVSAVAAGARHSLALRRDGTVWAWGVNGDGQLGRDGPAGDTPTWVEGLSSIVAIAAGQAHSLALRGDGTVWAWGNDFDGQLGDGRSGGFSPVPRQVRRLGGPLTAAVAIAAGGSHSLALRAAAP